MKNKLNERNQMETICKTKYLEFKSTKFNTESKWYYVKRTNDSGCHDSVVAITTLVKINDNYNFIFLKTKRPPLIAENKSLYCLESPAGLIADEKFNETLIECAKKELLEEVGIEANKLYIELTNSPTSGGLSSETISYITALSDSYKIISKPISDSGVITDRIIVPAENFWNFINSLNHKEISVSSSLVTGVYFALNRLANFI